MTGFNSQFSIAFKTGCTVDFTEIIGQKEVITSLSNSIKNDNVGHAIIFSGAKGIGKRSIAKIFANLLLCENHRIDKSCDECLSCRMLKEGSNPDFNMIDPDGDSIGIEEIRKIHGGIALRPMYSGRKVYLIVDADKMTLQAQNCLLKTLEEPPSYVVIILTTSNYSSLLQTIHSRCQKYNFKKNSNEEVRTFLRNSLVKNLANSDFIVSYSNGIIGRALELAQDKGFSLIRESTIDILMKLASSELLYIYEAYDFFDANKVQIDSIFDIMLMFYRDLLVFKESGEEKILINSDKKDIILNNAAGFKTQKLAKNIEAIEMTRGNIRQNANYQLSIEVMLMKLQEENT
jgi:DNA polymerase III subunit delta'